MKFIRDNKDAWFAGIVSAILFLTLLRIISNLLGSEIYNNIFCTSVRNTKNDPLF